MPSDSRHVAERIARPWQEVAGFVADPANLPRWAHGLGSGVERREGGWTAETPGGRIGIRFVQPNPYGVADHDVSLPTGEVVHVPLRVLPLQGGAEVVLTVQRAPGMTDDALEADAATVAADLARLKEVLELRTDVSAGADHAPEPSAEQVTENRPQTDGATRDV